MTFFPLLYTAGTIFSASLEPEKSLLSGFGPDYEDEAKKRPNKDRICQSILDKFDESMMEMYNEYNSRDILCHSISDLKCFIMNPVDIILGLWKTDTSEEYSMWSFPVYESDSKGKSETVSESNGEVFDEIENISTNPSDKNKHFKKDNFEKVDREIVKYLLEIFEQAYNEDQKNMNEYKYVEVEEVIEKLFGIIDKNNVENYCKFKSLKKRFFMEKWVALVDSDIKEDILTFEKDLKNQMKEYAIAIKIFPLGTSLYVVYNHFITTINPVFLSIIKLMGFERDDPEIQNMIKELGSAYSYLFFDYENDVMFDVLKFVNYLPSRASLWRLNYVLTDLIDSTRGLMISFMQHLWFNSKK